MGRARLYASTYRAGKSVPPQRQHKSAVLILLRNIRMRFVSCVTLPRGVEWLGIQSYLIGTLLKWQKYYIGIWNVYLVIKLLSKAPT
jgi:hypothetical protein